MNVRRLYRTINIHRVPYNVRYSVRDPGYNTTTLYDTPFRNITTHNIQQQTIPN